MSSDSRSRSAPKNLRARRKQETSREILEAAETVFVEHGVHGARMEEIAANAGVSVGTLYNYFDDRQALLDALWRLRHNELLAAMDAATGATTGLPFAEGLTAFIRTVTDHFQAHWALFSVLLESAADNAAGTRPVLGARATMCELYDRAERLVRDGVERGALRAADADHYPAWLIGMVRGMMMRRLVTKDPPSQDMVAPMVNFFMHGGGSPAQIAGVSP